MTITVAVPKETITGELRVALVPNLVARLSKLGTKIKIESNLGAGIYASDDSYKDVSVAYNAKDLYSGSDINIKVQPPSVKEVDKMKEGSVLISFLYPHLNPDIVNKLLERKMISFAMELIPRISRAQDMDVLSSQATLAGYKSVLIAANNCKFFFPMLTTAAGSIRPAKVLIIGVGVAGLQAISTARRLGAQVSAYDVRPETKEQTESLGAKFVDTGVSAIGAGGYARELTQDEKTKQNDVLKKHISMSDVIITTAGVPGKSAPRILSTDMIELMRPGSVIVDILADMGGNCDLTKPGETVIHKGVTIIGPVNINSSIAMHASEMYSRNLINFLGLVIQDGMLKLDWSDEIIAGAVVTENGMIKNSQVRRILLGGKYEN